jgi:cytochrome P450
VLGASNLILLDGDRHRAMRKLQAPAFHEARLDHYGELILRIAQTQAAGLPRGRSFSAHATMQRITLDVILQAIFGPSSPASQVEKNRAGERLWDFALESLFRHGLFNADPHPGNYLFDRDQVGFLDFGCVKRLSATAVEHCRVMARAILERDLARQRELGVSLGLIRDPRRFDFDF